MMNYSRRIQIAALLSVLIHATSLAVWHYTPAPVPTPLPSEPAPIELNLQPEPAPSEAPVQLVDVAQPSPEPVEPTPLIAEDNAEAMDQKPETGDQPSPQLTPDEFDQLAATPAPPAKPTPRPAPPQEKAPEDTEQEDDSKDKSTEEFPDTELEDILETEEGMLASDREEPIRIARADPAMPQRPSPGKSRAQNTVAKDGITNFQAIQNEIAPYLKQVREQVEKEWHEMLYTRYSGTSPVKAVIDCAISPSGQLVSVSVVGTDNDRLYSALCQDAVRRAGPFGPFPFEVPDIYRDKNLEIRWTFSFL